MTKEEQALLDAVTEMQKAFYALTGSQDAFNYNRLGEVLACIQLDIGLRWNTSFSGDDATDSNGNPVELKSTTQERINGTYNGLSKYDTKAEFLDYLDEKFPSNTRHIFTRKKDGLIVEAYELPNEDVISILRKKTNKFWDENDNYSYKGKDPRIGASVCMTEIKKYGKKLI